MCVKVEHVNSADDDDNDEDGLHACNLHGRVYRLEHRGNLISIRIFETLERSLSNKRSYEINEHD